MAEELRILDREENMKTQVIGNRLAEAAHNASNFPTDWRYFGEEYKEVWRCIARAVVREYSSLTCDELKKLNFEFKDSEP